MSHNEYKITSIHTFWSIEIIFFKQIDQNLFPYILKAQEMCVESLETQTHA